MNNQENGIYLSKQVIVIVKSFIRDEHYAACFWLE